MFNRTHARGVDYALYDSAATLPDAESDITLTDYLMDRIGQPAASDVRRAERQRRAPGRRARGRDRENCENTP